MDKNKKYAPRVQQLESTVPFIGYTNYSEDYAVPVYDLSDFINTLEGHTLYGEVLTHRKGSAEHAAALATYQAAKQAFAHKQAGKEQ